MSIKKQYITPNCKLILEGFGDNNAKDGQSYLSTITNAECHIIGSGKILSGGRGFLDSLVTAVSNYAQECLSGLSHSQVLSGNENIVHLNKIEHQNLHRLIVEPEGNINEQKVEITLNPIQLFDLIEAVDQLFADSRTLPDLSLVLTPLSKNHRQADEPIVQRSVPAIVGLASLALSGFALFLVPVPEIRQPEPNSNNNSNTPVTNTEKTIPQNNNNVQPQSTSQPNNNPTNEPFIKETP